MKKKKTDTIKNEAEIQELISSMVKNDTKAWSEFMKIFHDMFLGFVNSKASNLDGDNIVSNFYFKLIEDDFHRLKNFTYGDQVNLSQYLRFILYNEIMTESQQRNYNSSEILEEYQTNLFQKEETDEGYIYQDITHEMFMEAVMQLDNIDHRKSIYLLYLGNKNREIAEILDKPINTILSWNKRAKEQLAILLEKIRKGAIK
ncbi:RNA polymerase sigma factor [Leptospira sp. GIMC2001]|uniref:RNA polymerase sigma factor n=1 Tax=Leptospira sp. GIMC2001 TaxID=1513297 RepID=UPI00234978B0|nr:hypothetical protein [Leptospira sp. GIMC2001]WCL50764.1 hypothetical protein O4O04_08110 [Leptospira sp. GIMC2001]